MMLREQLLLDIEHLWRQVASRLDHDELMGTPPDGITIFEYPSTDAQNNYCTGTGTPIKTIDRNLRQLAPRFDSPPKMVEFSGAFYPHAVARFFVNHSQSAGVLGMTFGPRYGRGFRYTLNKDGSFTQRATWVS